MPGLGGGRQEVLSRPAQNHVVMPDAFARTLYTNINAAESWRRPPTGAAVVERELPQMV